MIRAAHRAVVKALEQFIAQERQAKATKYIKDKNYQIIMPTREVCLKGPCMIFKGNPANYLTEIQVLVQS